MNVSTGGKQFNINVGVVPQTAQAKTQLDAFIKQAEKTSDVKLSIQLKDNGAKTVIKQITTETGDLVTVTKKYDSANKLLDTSITKLQRNYKNLANATKQQQQAQQQLNNTTKHSKTIFSDFADTFLKMAKFNTINLIYDGLTNKMSETIKITNDFNAAMTEFKKVTDTTSLSLNDYTEQLGELGETTARTTTQMLASATEFSKAGFTPEESARLAQIASLYQNIADAEISAGEAASFITSQIKAFKDYGVEANNATQVIDKLNEVSNNFSVSSTDIASALTKQSASLAAYGNDLNKSIALVTSGTEIMTSQAGKVARGLKSTCYFKLCS